MQGTRYSPLAEITTANVANLKLAWSFSTGMVHGHEGQPLVVHNTMYVVTPWPNVVYAIDLTNPHGPLKWAYTPPTATASQGEACCDVVNRGASYADGKIIFNRLDDHTVALDANTGKVVWDTKLDTISLGATMTMAPLVIKDRVIVGNSGAELGVRGWLAGLDLKSGKVVWKAYSTGPDRDVLIGPDFKAPYKQLQGTDLGVKSWPPDQWKLGGGTPWGWVTYDPETNLLFYGTANPGVWNPDMRPGDNLWAATIIARDPETGAAKWAYQLTPHDSWDYDGVNESIVADLTIGGEPRKAIVHFDRNGFAYTIDRTTGRVLVAQPYQYTNWATGVNLQTGLPERVSAKQTHQGVNTTDICPSSTGARDQQPAAFSPRTKLFYTPSTNLCMDYRGLQASYIAGTPYLGADVRMYAGPGGMDARGELLAWDATTGKKVWGITERFPVWSGTLVTGGDVVFYGNMQGWFKAVDARTGKVLWQFKTGSGIVGNPMTFRGPDGKQYVAVYSGIGGWLGAVVPGHLSTDDPTAALGAVGAVPDLPKYSSPGGTLYVFSL
ncbi:MAG: methanol/ethanol family PQQ-dependent dehydrogenase [Gemmatimonadaceae bacterium]|nr:methanol/ethanol family PQQ-dependent dehydrogenase [Gemmatimonadaceae bacterium]